jgi:hypothetical protein
MRKEMRGNFIRQIFPRVFRLASVLSLTAIISGATMSYLMTGWKNLDTWIGSRWGTGIILGGLLGLSLTMFHFFIESRLEPVAISADESSEAEVEKILTVLKIVPRLGLAILIAIVLLMMYGARGL